MMIQVRVMRSCILLRLLVARCVATPKAYSGVDCVQPHAVYGAMVKCADATLAGPTKHCCRGVPPVTRINTRVSTILVVCLKPIHLLMTLCINIL